MSIGIGGAGSKLASLLDTGNAIIVNVSEMELDKVEASSKLRAVASTNRAALQGSRKDPTLAKEAFSSVRDVLLHEIQNNIVFTSTGGGTGNGICTKLLDHVSDLPRVALDDKTMFVFVLPYADQEAAEFVDNTIDFLEGPVARAIDTGNTGNIVLISNKQKFIDRQAELEYNQRCIELLRTFLDIPHKCDRFSTLDGTVDYEDFRHYCARPYFNHFFHVSFDLEKPIGEQIREATNPLLLPPAAPIESLFLLEVPKPEQAPAFYKILDYFANEQQVPPAYAVVHNPEIPNPLLTVSLLYSRQPLELVDDFNSISGQNKRRRIRKSLDQKVTLSKLEVDFEDETHQVARETGKDEDEVTSVLRRIGKL